MQATERDIIVANVDAFAIQRSDLNGFLFAEVGVEANGMTLSVLSTLARLGMDPWDEAGRLARQPRAAAIEGLARLIANMPASPWALADSTAIAARLVPLLPARGAGAAPSLAKAHTANVTNMGKQLLERLPMRGKESSSSSASNLGQRPSALLLVLLTGLLAGLTLYLVAQRSVMDQDSNIPAEIHPGGTESVSRTPQRRPNTPAAAPRPAPAHSAPPQPVQTQPAMPEPVTPQSVTPQPGGNAPNAVQPPDPAPAAKSL